MPAQISTAPINSLPLPPSYWVAVSQSADAERVSTRSVCVPWPPVPTRTPGWFPSTITPQVQATLITVGVSPTVGGSWARYLGARLDRPATSSANRQGEMLRRQYQENSQQAGSREACSGRPGPVRPRRGISSYKRVLRGLSNIRKKLPFGYPTRNRNDIEKSNGLCSYVQNASDTLI